jgi:predicted dehydrogenase
MVDAVRSTPGHRLQAVAARDPIKLATWAELYGVQSTTTQFDALVQDPEVDAVYVALPPSMHAHWTCRAMQYGKKVLCEKPLAGSPHEALEIQKWAEQSSMTVQHATAFPFHPRSNAMREVIRSGRLGELTRVTVACSASHILHRGNDHRMSSPIHGGCLLDLGWYCVYATLWMTGLKPQSIRAYGKRLNSNGPWLSCQAIVELENQATAIWDCGFDVAARKWIEIAGNQASVICDDFSRPWDPNKPRFWVHGQDGKASVEMAGEGVFQESQMLARFVSDSLAETKESLALAVTTQQILNTWELAMYPSPRSV